MTAQDVADLYADLEYVTCQRDIAWAAIQAIKSGPPPYLNNDEVAAWAMSEADKGLAAVPMNTPTSLPVTSEKTT